MLGLSLAAATVSPAAALTPEQLLGKIFPQQTAPHAKRSRMKPPAARVPTKPPLPAPKPDAAPAAAADPAAAPPLPEASPEPATQTAEPPRPAPDPRAPAEPETKTEPNAAEPQPSEPEASEPAVELAPATSPAPAAPPIAEPLPETVPPTAPLGEPAPPAGTVIAPADALGPVIPPVQPAILPPPPAEATPGSDATPNPDATPKPEAKPDVPPAASNEPPRYLPTAQELAACSAGMTALGITSTAEPPIVEGECGAPDPFTVTALQAGAVSLAPAATIDCAMASALASWVTDDVQSAAKAAFGAPVTTIDVAGSYTCRGRNNVPGARLSEHAFANAIDISGFKIGDRTVSVAKTDGQSATDAAFIELIRLAACRRFTTVLGPGSDVEHASHLHLDAIKRGRTGDYRICE